MVKKRSLWQVTLYMTSSAAPFARPIEGLLPPTLHTSVRPEPVEGLLPTTLHASVRPEPVEGLSPNVKRIS
jgi:hypothetical protein